MVFGLPRRRPHFRWYEPAATVVAVVIALIVLAAVCLWALNYEY